ncbi:MAG TPA: hypothetical protein VFQ23_19155 [Anaerolineales bacterium]|nr:hypothetical protein [Anaerolineales bacterium]
MIELRFKEFYEQNYEDEEYCLYVMKNGLGDVLYVGISTDDVWSRWFGGTGHIPWSGTKRYGNSTIGEKITNHLPESLEWNIQLWTLKDCLAFCEMEPPDPNFKPTAGEYNDAVRTVEARMIKKLSPSLNRHLNLNPGKDTTPKSEKELKWEKYVAAAYDEIFNKKTKG